MSVKILNAAGYRIFLAVIVGLLCVVESRAQAVPNVQQQAPANALSQAQANANALARGQAGPTVKMNHTARQIKPGVYSCIIYAEVDREVSNSIDDITFTLPPGFSNRKQRADKTPYGLKVRFSSKPFITTEEVMVNVLVDFKGRSDQYITYKLVLFTRK